MEELLILNPEASGLGPAWRIIGLSNFIVKVAVPIITNNPT